MQKNSEIIKSVQICQKIPNIDWQLLTENNESPIDQNYDVKAKNIKKSEQQRPSRFAAGRNNGN